MNKLITGGARSGKSEFAESLLKENDDVLYVATYINDHNDEEMAARIKRHQLQRNSNWQTKEVSYTLDIKSNDILLDCLSVFCSNVLYYFTKNIDDISNEKVSEIEKYLMNEIDKLFENCYNITVVTNEVGNGLVPTNQVERVYRDLLGRINRYVANKVDEVYLVVCGQNIKIKG
ncbi:bifunctional adenosylcobinamide kinase/adenosylcobinamide-phosphate guanylyltransferase [Erysipelotrichaceae bacterium OttesenSCG-928-M19]|nr:bifunctional adenosylcobinamide kinase/adenosylcobinamide-phosphate guanylyltransferase [Erysipelotrichaceae bacterium OttesenSCG-928-M19]